MWAKQRQSGFTIVELLIVIVVIGILAAITIVAYGGFQQRASNTQTLTSLSAWIKGMKLYKADIGHWPSGFGYVCLGEGYKYGVTGEDTSGTAQCRQSGASGFTEKPAFVTALKPYIGNNLPTPAFVTARNTDTEWRRGLSYYYGGGSGTVVYIDAALSGTMSSCPLVDGITASQATWNGNTVCGYVIGATTDT